MPQPFSAHHLLPMLPTNTRAYQSHSSMDHPSLQELFFCGIPCLCPHCTINGNIPGRCCSLSLTLLRHFYLQAPLLVLHRSIVSPRTLGSSQFLAVYCRAPVLLFCLGTNHPLSLSSILVDPAECQLKRWHTTRKGQQLHHFDLDRHIFGTAEPEKKDMKGGPF